MDEEEPAQEMLETITDEVDGDKVSVADIMDTFGSKSFGPVLLLLGLIVVLPPMGAIPGIPAIVGLVIILFSKQIVFGRDHIWLPQYLENRSIARNKLEAAKNNAKPYLKYVDMLIAPRMTWLFEGPSLVLVGVVVSILALSMIPLELLPFAVALPGAAIAQFGLAITSRDGILLIGALIVSLAAGLTVGWYFWGY